MSRSDRRPSLEERCFQHWWAAAQDNMFLLRVERDGEDFYVESLNPAHERVISLSLEQRQQPLRALLDRGFYERVAENYRRCVRTREVLTYEEAYLDERGAYTYWETQLTPVFAEAGAVSHIIGRSRNISRARLAEQQLEASRRAAERADQVKAAFLANMSHEMRTPLNGIAGAASLMLETDDPSEQRALAGLIQQSVDALSQLTANTLDFARLNAGAVSLQLAPFDLVALVEDALRDIAPEVAARSLALRVELPPGAVPAVRGDAARLRQVLDHLLRNALKFTVEGEIAVSVQVESSVDGMLRSVLRVADTGVGIAEGDIGSLFQPFAQLDASSTRSHQGVGLGLAISGRLVELMGGSIVVDSSPGQGSCFSVRLPFQPVAASLATAGGGSAAVPLRGRVLVVEDNPTNSLVLERILRRAGLEVLCAADGEEAVRAFQQERVDLILMDWHMPNMDGLQATRTIRMLGGRMPILGLTANVLPEQQEICLRAGMQDVITKPVSREKLLGRLGCWLAAEALSG